MRLVVERLYPRRSYGFAASRTPADAAELKQLHQQYADRLVLLPLGVTSVDSITVAAHAVSATTDALDVLINNAGVYPHAGSGDDHQRLGQLTHDDAIETMQVNAIGPGLRAPFRYSASKAALNMYMRKSDYQNRPPEAEFGDCGPRLGVYRHGAAMLPSRICRFSPRRHSLGRAVARQEKRQIHGLARSDRTVVSSSNKVIVESFSLRVFPHVKQAI